MEPTRSQGRVSSEMRSRASTAPSTQAKKLHPKGELREVLKALAAKKVHASARSILSVLWTYTDAQGGCWPSQETLARQSGYSVRTVRTALQRLERAGMLLREVPVLRDRRARRQTTVYRITLRPEVQVAPPEDRAEARVESSLALQPAPSPQNVETAPEPVLVTASEPDAPEVILAGWTQVEVPENELPPRAVSPARVTPRSPATGAARRIQKINFPLIPQARPGLAQPAVVRALPPPGTATRAVARGPVAPPSLAIQGACARLVAALRNRAPG